MPNLGVSELLVILVIVLLLFGGVKKFSDMGAGLGKGIRNFRRAMSGEDDEEKKNQPGGPGPDAQKKP